MVRASPSLECHPAGTSTYPAVWRLTDSYPLGVLERLHCIGAMEAWTVTWNVIGQKRYDAMLVAWVIQHSEACRLSVLGFLCRTLSRAWSRTLLE
jgi:hypothetical protein